MIARIISIDGTNAKKFTVTGPTSPFHSKFIKRRKHVEETLLPSIKSLPVISDVQIFEAITSENYVDEGAYCTLGDIRITKGNFGCMGNFMSNFMLWKYSVEHNTPILVLEDDARLPESSVDTICKSITEYETLNSPDVLYLLSESPSDKGRIKNYLHVIPLGEHLCRVTSCDDFAGTAAYCVNPRAAARLMERGLTVGHSATDAFIHHSYWENRIGMLVPKNFTQSFMLHEVWADWNLSSS